MSHVDRLLQTALGLAAVAAVVVLPSAAACDPATVAALAAQLDADADAARWEAASSLGRCGAAAVPALEQACAADRARVRQGAARALGLIGPEAASALPVLTAALGDPEPLVRERAAEALGRLGPTSASAIPSLVAAFADEDPYLAGAAAVALGRIGAASVPALTRALADPRDNVRWSAAVALGRIGPPAAGAAAPALVRALGDTTAPARASAAVALGAIGPLAIDAVPALTEVLHDRDEDVRRAARIAIAQIAPSWRAAPPAGDEVIATIDRLVPSLMEEHRVPGVSIALIDDGRVAWSKAYGVSDAAKKTPVTAGTLFEAASMSKPVFAILVLRFADEGRLDLDQPLVGYSSEPCVPDQPGRRQITARMALSHTTGLPNWRPGEEEREGPLPLLFEPGTRFGYSGEGVFYLQRVVEEIAGQPLDLLAREALFDALGLKLSSFAWSPEVEGALAGGHGENGEFLTRSKYTHPNAAYTLYTNTEEYARIIVEVMNAARSGSEILSQSSAREMLRSQVALDARDPIERPFSGQGRAVYWGLGWSSNTTPGGDIFHHGGANRTGFRCFSQFSLDRGSGLVIMTNGLGGGELWTRLVATIGDW
jgi:CubicO group peptidase (beta-lactamase class C family)